ncbi:hypothetical protein V1272_001077 [Bradyrhizobium sp. AZCC 1708]
MNWRRESALDLYNPLLSMFPFLSPWLYARTSEAARGYCGAPAHFGA